MNDCFNIIFKYLSVYDVVIWATVSRYFYDIANRDSVWESMLSTDFAVCKSIDNHKINYMKLYKLDCLFQKALD